MGECRWVEVGRELKKDWWIDGSNETRNQSVRWEWRESRKVQHEKSGLDGVIRGEEWQRASKMEGLSLCLGSLSLSLSFSRSVSQTQIIGVQCCYRKTKFKFNEDPWQPPTTPFAPLCLSVPEHFSEFTILENVGWNHLSTRWSKVEMT